MIPQREIQDLANEWRLRADVVEKDYVLGWMLAGISAEPALASWVFKGGTALRKCYFETYRLSEDLDFSIQPGGPSTPDELRPIFERIRDWLAAQCGLEIVISENSFRARQNRRNRPTTEGRIGFRGPRQAPMIAKVKLDLTTDEVVVDPPVAREIHHPYSDAPQPLAAVPCYSSAELLAEKLRALEERCRPRDLYDVVMMHRHPDVIASAAEVARILVPKCAHAGVPVPTAEIIRGLPFRAEIEQEWGNMLAHQLPTLPPFAQFWGDLDSVFAWLEARVATAPEALPRVEVRGQDLDRTWVAPRMMTAWRTGAPIELIRFAGASRLLVEVDYQAERGRQGPRVVEPYSLRRTRDGQVVLFVVNDRGEPRAYRVDRIRSARVLDRTFTPRYLVEF